MSFHVDKSSPSHTRPYQQIKCTQTAIASPSKNAAEKEKKSKSMSKLFALHTNVIILKY